MQFFRSLQADPRRLAVVVFAAALLVRIAYLLDIRSNPFFLTPVIDAEFYHQMAQQLAGPGVGHVPFQMPPLYPFVLSLVYRVAGPSLLAAHLLQILLGASAATLTFAIARRMGGVALGLVAAAFVATSKALLYLEGDVLATPLCICLDLLGLWFLVRWVQDGERRRDAVCAGVALGLSALALPLVLIVAAAFALWMLRRGRRAAAAAFALAVVLPILPVTLRNWHASGEPVLVSANGGINFWMGNNPDARRTSSLRPGPEWRAMQELPLHSGRILSSSARDRWFLREGLRFWTASPGRALAHTGEKLLLLVHAHEIMRDFDFGYFRDHYSRLLRLPGWNFAWLFALAVVGWVAARPRPPAEMVLRLFVASYALGVVLFFVTARYRAPLVPVLAVYAGQGILALVGGVRLRRWRALALPAGLGVAAFVVSTVDWLDSDRVDTVEAEYRVATTFEKRGQLEEAMQRYDAVLRRDPDHALAAARAAVCAQYLGRPQDAVERYEVLLDRHPDYAEAAVNLANLAAAAGDRDVAQHYFDTALAADPYLAQGHASYGLFLLQNGDATEAVAAIGKALEYDPNWEALRIDFARALLAAQDVSGAAREIERAAAIMPESDRLQLVRGDVLAAQGQTAEARAAWERGLRVAPQNPELQQRLSGAARP